MAVLKTRTCAIIWFYYMESSNGSSIIVLMYVTRCWGKVTDNAPQDVGAGKMKYIRHLKPSRRDESIPSFSAGPYRQVMLLIIAMFIVDTVL